MKAQDIITRFNRLKSDRSHFDALFNEVRHWYNPEAGDFQGNNSSGGIKNSHIYNPKGRLNARRLSQVLYSTMMPVHEQFFSLVPMIEESSDMKAWWAKATEILSVRLAESNLPHVAMEMLRNLVLYGTPVSYCFYEDSRLVYQAFYPENTWIDTDFRDQVNVVVYTKKDNAANIVQQFGKEKLPEKLLKLAGEVEQSDDIEIIHYFCRDYSTENCDDESWKMYVVEGCCNTLIREYSFPGQPLQIPRWEHNSYEKYGRSPAMDGLEIVKDLQRIEKTVRRQSEKHVDPPIAMPFDASISAVEMAYDTEPGGVVEVMADAAGNVVLPQPIGLGGDIKVGEYQIDKNERMLDEVFFLDVLTIIMQTKEQATATQINSMNAEKMDLVTPLVMGLINDFVKPLIKRSFMLLLENEEIPPPPFFAAENDSYQLDFEVDVKSSLLLKLRTMKLQSSLQVLGVLGQLGEFNPGILDRINFDRLAEEFVVTSAMPTDAVRSGTELRKYRDQQARQQRLAGEQAVTMEALKNMSKKVDPNKPVKKDSIVGKLVNG